MKLLSAIVPCYNEEENVRDFYDEFIKNQSFFKEKDLDFELIYVDDGSRDHTVAEVKKLIEAVNHKNFGWLTDMGNFLCADEDPVHAMQTGAKMAVHAHAKDFHYKKQGEFLPKQGWFGTRGGNHLRGAIIGHGVVDVPACLRLLKEAGYDGWLSVEFEGMEDCIMALKADLENLKAMEAEIK